MNPLEMAKQRNLNTEEKCIDYLERMRWPQGVRCPTCGRSSISRFQTKGKSGKTRHLYQCLDKSCRYQFSPTTGTIFHDSHLPLNKWFQAIALLCDAEPPMSINQLRLALGVQYKTAAHVTDRIRKAIANGTIELRTTRSSQSVDPSPIPDTAAQRGGSAAGQAPATQERVSRLPVGGTETPASIAQRRAATAALLNQIARKPGKESVSGTAIDNMLSMFVSMAQMSVRPPLYFVKYLRDKVFT